MKAISISRKLRARTCNGCKAFIICSYSTCELGYSQGHHQSAYWPMTMCEKPRTNAELSMILRMRHNTALSMIQRNRDAK